MTRTVDFFRRAGGLLPPSILFRTVEDESHYNPLRRLSPTPLPRGESLKYCRSSYNPQTNINLPIHAKDGCAHMNTTVFNDKI